eukprot:173618-Hanusia_phi.AAC.1
MGSSEVVSSPAYKLALSPPSIYPDGGVFVEVVDVRIRCKLPGAEAHYVVDPILSDTFDPNPMSKICFDTVHLSETNMIIKAICTYKNLEPSTMTTSKTFILEPHPPTFDPDGGSFVESTQ